MSPFVLTLVGMGVVFIGALVMYQLAFPRARARTEGKLQRVARVFFLFFILSVAMLVIGTLSDTQILLFMGLILFALAILSATMEYFARR